jgi:hypothetical protein
MLQIKRYYQFKQKHSNLYDGLVPTKNKNIFDHNILTVLPNRDQFGRRVLILELGSESLSNGSFSEERDLVERYNTSNYYQSPFHLKKACDGNKHILYLPGILVQELFTASIINL